MLDRIHMFIPFRHDRVQHATMHQSDEPVYSINLEALGVPLLRFVAVDFSAQRPDWYVEPSVEAA